MPGVGVADQRDPELIAAREPALVVVALDNLQLFLQLRETIADLAAIEFEIGFARADALLSSTAWRFPQARRDVFQPCHLHLELGLAAVGMAVKDLHDHTRAIEYLRTGCALEVARLVRRDVMVDDHELRLRRRFGIRLCLLAIQLVRVGILKALAGLRLANSGHRSDDAGATGNCREFRKPPLAQHRRAVDLVALLRQRADDLVTERAHQTAQFCEVSGMRDIVDARKLDANEDRARNRWSGFHDAALAGSFLCRARAWHVSR